MSRSVQTATARDVVAAAELEFDRAPITNARYREFVASSGHRPPAYWENGTFPDMLHDHPVVGVDYFDAVAFARWAGGCLPSELEWVLASGLEEPRAYPWGDRFDRARCNTVSSGRKGTSPVGAYPPAPSGCVDLCGNVWEMTCNADREGAVIVKGGSWYDYPAHAKIDHSFGAPVERVGRTVGFRLCYGRPERHPDFLDRAALEAGIEARRGRPARPAPEATEHFDLRALQAELRPVVGILPRMEVTHADVAGMLAWLDEAAPVLPISNGANKNKTSRGRDAIVSRVQTLFVKRPGLMVATVVAALLLVATTLVAAVSNDARGRGEPREAGPEIARVHAPRATARPRRRIVRRITRTTPARAPEAAPVTRASLERALAATGDASEQARLRYELVKLDEKKNGAGEPMPVTVLPSRGLVFVTDRLGAVEHRCIETLRRVGRVERLDVTLVYTGPLDIGEIVANHGKALGFVYVVTDPEKSFAADHELTAARAVSGLRTDGRVAFTLHGTPTRAIVTARLGGLR